MKNYLKMKFNTSESIVCKLEKYVSKLMVPAERAKKSLIDCLEKSVKSFQGQAKSALDENKKSLFNKKEEKASKDLNVLKVLSEEEIVRYALSNLDNIIKIATNKRSPREERLKARVAAHKPLSTHLTQLKNKLNKAQEEKESGSEDEQDNNVRCSVNNTVVLMRKDVKRAKVHIIHKLTRQIKQLREAKGNEEVVAKNQRKAERLGKKVIHIKELDEDEISKFALTATQNLNQLAYDIKASSRSQALATVAINKFVAPHVKDFKTKHPDLQKIVPNLLKKKKRKFNLETNDIEKTKSKFSQSNIKSEDSQSDNKSNDSQSEQGDESDDSGSEKLDENDDSESEVENTLRAERSSNEKIVNKRKKRKNCVSKMSISIGNFKTVKKNPKEVNKIKNRVKDASLSSPVDTVEEKPKVIDPFFVTTKNEDYVTSQAPLSGENGFTSGKNKHLQPKKSGKLITFDNKKKWERTNSEGKYGKVNRFHGFPPYKKTISSSFDNTVSGPRSDKLVFGNRKERRKALQQTKVEEKVEKLHPSWEAKKKQTNIIPFQGKKVTFD